MATYTCIQCGTAKQVVPARLPTAKFCSVKCRAEWRKVNFKGENNPKWKGGARERKCQHCGNVFAWQGQPLSSFNNRKFCSKECVVAGQKRLIGSEHPWFSPTARRRNRTGLKYTSWQNAVLSRDKAACQRCGARNTELHAHHIKSWKDHPELRFEVSNGITVCAPCHWAIHTAENENAVNSVKPPPAHRNAEGNTEPSLDRKIVEGVTTRGRAYRRFETSCEWCGAFVSRPVARLKYSKHHFCSKSCAGKYSTSKRYGSNASTSAAAERQEIV